MFLRKFANFKLFLPRNCRRWVRANNLNAVPEEHQSRKDYCKEKFNAICVTFELPWFGLNTADMRAKGARAFTALALAAIAERGW